jgi:DNA-binding IclR family transcriptional regulator
VSAANLTEGDGAPMRAALAGGSYSQTLSRGVQVLEVIAGRDRPMSAGELSVALDMHRSVVYRLVRTLEEHRLLKTEPDGRYTLGLGLLTLARSVQRDLRSAAFLILADLSERLNMTAIVGVVEGDEIVCVASVEPPTGLQVRYREGYRHATERGAGGLAVLSGLPVRGGERPEVAEARRRGYAVTRAELEEGTVAVSAPVLIPRQPTRMSVTALIPPNRQLEDVDTVGRLVIAAAGKLATFC